MKKAKEHAEAIITAFKQSNKENVNPFTEKMTEVFMDVAGNEIVELRKARNIKVDSGLIPIFKDQRKKFGSIVTIVNETTSDLLHITDFDGVIEELYPNIYDWYKKEVLNN